MKSHLMAIQLLPTIFKCATAKQVGEAREALEGSNRWKANQGKAFSSICVVIRRFSSVG